jgi:UDP-N-acetylmuramoyl-tripeptide--D-alanyl-D-alanine ligase
MNPLHLLTTSLLIYQQEDYSLSRWWKWWKAHPFITFQKPKVSLRLTDRIKLLLVLGLGLWLGFISVALYVSLLLGIFVGLLSFVFPAVFMVLGVLALTPFAHAIENKRRVFIQTELKQHPELTAIGITGSYGKTSVKDLLFQILDGYRYTLMTPENFNTPGGLARTVKHELSDKHRFFLCEMGAYYPGDIADLCSLVKPSWGVLTAVGPQHLERFGSIEMIAATKSELINAIAGKHTVINWDSKPLRDYVEKRNLIDRVVRVSRRDPTVEYFIEQVEMGEAGISFALRHQNKIYDFSTPLFGTASLYNSALATSTALAIGVPTIHIEAGLKAALPSPHRLELSTLHQATLVDNTYSGNVDSFLTMIEDLKQVKGKKALVTPGLVELGQEEESLHRLLGQKAAEVYDAVVLVGESAKSMAIREGLRQARYPGDLQVIENNYTTYWAEVHRLAKLYDWVVLENDLPERYS